MNKEKKNETVDKNAKQPEVETDVKAGFSVSGDYLTVLPGLKILSATRAVMPAVHL